MPSQMFNHNGMTGILCMRGGRRCKYCRNESAYQCDMPLEARYKSGKRKGTRRTCDTHLCEDHVRHGETKGIDFCIPHYEHAKAAKERRDKANAR